MESHVVSRLQFHPPIFIFVFRRTQDEAEGSTEPVECERLHLDAAIINRPKKLSHKLVLKGRGFCRASRAAWKLGFSPPEETEAYKFGPL